VTLEPTTILGTATVLGVLEGPEEGWARVMLPGRPNGSEGWVNVVETMLSVVNGQVVVDLSERTLTYYEHGDEVLVTAVAVGSSRNPTPTGSFFITDTVTLADPNSPWGPHAFGLSARSETITEYNGGDGIIGIHGTDQPGSIGDAASLGCVRVPNDVITQLHEVISIGTPVEIRA
jgi:lipoprotein-anchoring transpeptidase ErfK/SrfK